MVIRAWDWEEGGVEFPLEKMERFWRRAVELLSRGHALIPLARLEMMLHYNLKSVKGWRDDSEV